MSAELDSGFFEPFRNNVKSINHEGLCEIRLPENLLLDPVIIKEYFDGVVIKWEANGQRYFEGYAKSNEIKQIIAGMFEQFNIDSLPPISFCR